MNRLTLRTHSLILIFLLEIPIVIFLIKVKKIEKNDKFQGSILNDHHRKEIQKERMHILISFTGDDLYSSRPPFLTFSKLHSYFNLFFVDKNEK